MQVSKKKKSINTVLSFPKVISSSCESISVHQHVLSQWSLKALGTSQPRTYTTKESLSAALAHLNRTTAELVGLMSCRTLNRTHFPRALTLPSGVQGTWTWLYAEPRWCAPCSGPWYGPTWSPGRCGHGPRCPAVYQRHHASQSGAWGAEQTRDQSAWLKKMAQGGISPATSGGSDLSAPAQDNILLMRITWKGCRRMRMWKPSLPQVFTMYLLAQMRAASRAAVVEEEQKQSEVNTVSQLRPLKLSLRPITQLTSAYIAFQTDGDSTTSKMSSSAWF